MILSNKTFSNLLFTFVVTILVMACGTISAQSAVATTSFAPAVMPLQVLAIEANLLEIDMEENASYAASYPGGTQELESFLQTNVVYPEIAQDNSFEGTTIVQFKVLPDGSLGEFSVEQSTHAICDQEVIKALRQMKNWTPAKVYGKEIATLRRVAVDFKLTF